MVVDDLDIESVAAFKTKTHPPLFVDTNTPLACPITFQGFEAIGGRLAQILDPIGKMQMLQASDRTTHDIRWKSLGGSGGKQPLRFPVDKAPDHPVTPVYLVGFRSAIVNNMFTMRKHGEHEHA